MGVTGRKSSRKGVVLPLVVLLIVILALMGWGLLTLGLNARVLAARKSAEIVARAAADAGISRAVQLMNNKMSAGPSWDVGPIPDENDVPLPNANSTYSYHVGAKSDGYHQITSTGRSQIAEKIINARLEYASIWFGIGVKESIDVKVGATFESPYADFSIRTNSTGTPPDDGTIILKSGVTIPGDVVIGPGGDLDDVINIKSTTVIEGDSYAASEPIDFPPVTLPEELLATCPTATTYNYVAGQSIGDPNAGGTQYFRFDEISIPQAGVQEITPGCDVVIYVEGTTILGQSAELIVTPGASMTLYLGGDMEAKNSNGLDNMNDIPDALVIYGLDTCENIDLKAKGEVFLGLTYAPEADLDVYAKNTISGAFTGRNFTMMNDAHFIYMPPEDQTKIEAPAYLVVRWWEE